MTGPRTPDIAQRCGPGPLGDGARATESPSDDGPREGGGRDADRRWRLLLGADGHGGTGLSDDDERIDRALSALYDVADEEAPTEPRGDRSPGLGASAPRVNRWLGDIRRYFPAGVVQVMQRDAVERLDLVRLLAEPELLESFEPDVHLAATLIGLARVLPETSRRTARQVVGAVVADVERRIADRTRSAVAGALARATRRYHPPLRDVDLGRTIGANLRHYLPEQRTVVPERLIGYGRRDRSVQRDVIVAIDQSGSMAQSVVYASVYGAVLASLRSLRTSVVAFGSEVTDLTPLLADPVEVLFGAQLGGGTDINRALAYCQRLITRPADTLLVLVTDLFEGPGRADLVTRLRRLRADGVVTIVLLALSDEGAPAYDRELAAAVAAIGVPAFACTPDAFPDLLAAALAGDDVTTWIHRHQAGG